MLDLRIANLARAVPFVYQLVTVTDKYKFVFGAYLLNAAAVRRMELFRAFVYNKTGR